jgi:hypothetical protein
MEDYTAQPPLPRSGEVYALGTAASVQFTTRPILFRVIRVETGDTYAGWVWLDGYEINTAGDAVERRSVFVQLAGLHRRVESTREQRPRTAPLARNQRQLPGRQPGNAQVNRATKV